MIFEGVNFNEKAIGQMSFEKFEQQHVNLFWKDKDAATRSKMLKQAYGLIVKPAKPTKRKADN